VAAIDRLTPLIFSQTLRYHEDAECLSALEDSAGACYAAWGVVCARAPTLRQALPARALTLARELARLPRTVGYVMPPKGWQWLVSGALVGSSRCSTPGPASPRGGLMPGMSFSWYAACSSPPAAASSAPSPFSLRTSQDIHVTECGGVQRGISEPRDIAAPRDVAAEHTSRSNSAGRRRRARSSTHSVVTDPRSSTAGQAAAAVDDAGAGVGEPCAELLRAEHPEEDRPTAMAELRHLREEAARLREEREQLLQENKRLQVRVVTWNALDDGCCLAVLVQTKG